jgi:hypothetical protein
MKFSGRPRKGPHSSKKPAHCKHIYLTTLCILCGQFHYPLDVNNNDNHFISAYFDTIITKIYLLDVAISLSGSSNETYAEEIGRYWKLIQEITRYVEIVNADNQATNLGATSSRIGIGECSFYHK